MTVKLHPVDAAARGVVARIDELFAIDAQARQRNLDFDARHALWEPRDANNPQPHPSDLSVLCALGV